MELIEQVEHHEILDLTEFSKEKYVRKSVMQSKGIVCDFVCFEPGQSARFHKHPVQDEIFYVVEGKGVITFQDRDDIPVKPGSVVYAFRRRAWCRNHRQRPPGPHAYQRPRDHRKDGKGLHARRLVMSVTRGFSARKVRSRLLLQRCVCLTIRQVHKAHP